MHNGDHAYPDNRGPDDHDGGRPLAFVLGKGQVLKGLDQGLTGMCVGEKRTLVLALRDAHRLRSGYGGAGP